MPLTEKQVEPVRELIQSYQYGMFHILNNGIQIYANRNLERVMLDPFYQYHALSRRGCCTELMLTAEAEIHLNFPEFYITKARGNNSLFSYPCSPHLFLLLSQYDLMDKREKSLRIYHRGYLGEERTFGKKRISRNCGRTSPCR